VFDGGDIFEIWMVGEEIWVRFDLGVHFLG